MTTVRFLVTMREYNDSIIMHNLLLRETRFVLADSDGVHVCLVLLMPSCWHCRLTAEIGLT